MFVIKKMDLTKIRVQTIEKLFNHTYQELTLDNFHSRWEKVVNGIYTCLVLDFDGTLRETGIRNGFIDSRFTSEIARIVSNNGVEIYLATGRRSSGLILGRELIRKGVSEIKMILGNGVEIISFPSEKVIHSINPFKSSEQLTIYRCLISKCKFDRKKVFSSNNMIRIFMDCESCALDKVQEVIETIKLVCPRAIVTHSGLNIEIVPNGATKEIAIYRLLGARKRTEALAIGDSCSKYGNDFGMLSIFPSFCVSIHSKECIAWTLPVIDNKGALLTGPNATLYLLNHMFINP